MQACLVMATSRIGVMGPIMVHGAQKQDLEMYDGLLQSMFCAFHSLCALITPRAPWAHL